MKEKAPAYESQELREFGEVLRGRRTINLFLQTPVPDALLRDAIEAAIWAPNHHVTEPWRFYRLGAQAIENCLELCREIVAAKKGDKAADFKRQNWSEKPGWVAVTCKHSEDALLERENYAACSAAVQNMLLYLWKAGIGSKWTTGDITRDPRFFEIIAANPREEFVVALVWYGYPKLTPTQSRKGLDQVLKELP